MSGIRAIHELRLVTSDPYEPLLTPASAIIGDTPPPASRNNMFSVCTWNVSGCSGEADRDTVDLILSRNHIQVACLQETRMATCTARTADYDWFNVNSLVDAALRMGGGTSVVVRRSQLHGYFFSKSFCQYLLCSIANI